MSDGLLNFRGAAIGYDQILEHVRTILANRRLVECTIEFLTPFRFTRDGRDVTTRNLRPSDLVRYAARRVFILDYLYYSAGRALPFRMTPDLVSRLKDWADSTVKTENSLAEVHIRLKEGKNYLVGKIRLEVPVAGGEPLVVFFLLKLCEYLGLGKYTTYGMGQYTLSWRA
ncbi:MAG: CRISPR system precrRNA processing endoribonuclease RAMP protein Cas6 [Aigarchaeota archaeon]|nr:CRISPR system precrRNA processing endoribonuclease RAMP protein Cas6 [Candidatus Calditenuaceae archaeon]